MTATDPVATLERGLAEWKKWALEPAEQDALLWCEQALEMLRDRLQAETPVMSGEERSRG